MLDSAPTVTENAIMGEASLTGASKCESFSFRLVTQKLAWKLSCKNRARCVGAAKCESFSFVVKNKPTE